MLKKYIKKILAALAMVFFAITLAQEVPGMADGNVAKAEGHLAIEGKGDYSMDYTPPGSIFCLPGWVEYKDNIKTAKVNVQDITSTRDMFFECRNLTSLDLSNFNTSNIKDNSYFSL